MPKVDKVKVLLSTYNGEKYLVQVLDSLLNQTDLEVSLLIRDDGSTDHTREILADYNKNSSVKVLLGDNVGWRDSFMTLLSLVPHDDESDYYAFADQDDLYDSDKLISAVQQLRPFSQPTLYHSNVVMADGAGHPLGDRYPRDFTPTQKFPQCFFDVTWLGTTMVFNKQLMVLLSQHVPIDNIVHDAYVINVAQLFGHVIYDSQPHMRYRRHEGSVTGFGSSSSTKKIKSPSLLDRYRRYKKVAVSNPFSRRAREILKGYNGLLNPNQRKILTWIATYRTSLTARLNLLLNPQVRASSPRVTLQIRYRVMGNSL